MKVNLRFKQELKMNGDINRSWFVLFKCFSFDVMLKKLLSCGMVDVNNL